MSEPTPKRRVGDRDRRAVDDQLMAAVGDGVLTLAGYDEGPRCLACPDAHRAGPRAGSNHRG